MPPYSQLGLTIFPLSYMLTSTVSACAVAAIRLLALTGLPA